MLQQFLTLDDIAVSNGVLLIREDFNVPIKNGVVQSEVRIRAALPGIKQALEKCRQVILMSHLGRPEPGIWQPEYSLQPVATCLQQLLGLPINFVALNFAANWYDNTYARDDQVVLLENVRFVAGETAADPQLAARMADLCDVFVMDAFGSAHRAHASTVEVAKYAAIAVAGPLLAAEVAALDHIMQNPQPPLVAIIGGAKVSTKLEVLHALVDLVDVLIVGGGMANTLLAAQGFDVKASLCEPDLFTVANELLNRARQQDCAVLLPSDMVWSHDKIMDIGPRTIQNYSEIIDKAATILWNGPLGVFEAPDFATGTQQIARAIANSSAYSVVGGGDTIAALEQLHLTSRISYISTGGGAFLEYIEGKQLPAIQALVDRAGGA